MSINSQENVTYAQNLSNSKISSFTITSSVPIQNLLFGTDHIWSSDLLKHQDNPDNIKHVCY